MVVIVVDVVVVVFAGAVEVVVVVVVGEAEVVVVLVVVFGMAVVSVLEAAEVDVEVAVVVAVAGEAGRSCVSLVVVASDGAAVALTASAVVGVASEPPSPLSSDEHAAANKIAATHTARMFLKISFLANFMYCAQFLVFRIGNIDFHREKNRPVPASFASYQRA